MDVTQRISALIALAVEWPHARACLIAGAVAIPLIVGYTWSSGKPQNELVSIEAALAQSPPARVVLPSTYKVSADQVPQPISTPQIALAVPVPPPAMTLQPEAATVPASVVAAPAAWGAMLGVMTRPDLRRDTRHDRSERAAAPPREIAPRAATVEPLGRFAERPKAASSVRRARRARIVRYVYVEPRRSAYRRYQADPVGDASRSVSRNIRTLSRVLSSIGN